MSLTRSAGSWDVGGHDASAAGSALKPTQRSEPLLPTALTELHLSGQVYHIKKLLARGGMAEVFLAERRGPAEFVRKVVVKKILREHNADTLYVQRFIREASLAARLHHPNIVEVFELANLDRDYYIVMEYVDGHNLHDLSRACEAQNRPMPVMLTAKIAADVAGALHYAHTFVGEDGVRQCIVHRDVSTTNIMITSAGQVKLVDFGLAKDINATSLTVGTSFVGKPLFVSPEAVQGGKPNPSWDVYSLGMVLYLLLAGRPPFELSSGDVGMAALVFDIVKREPSPLCNQNKEVPRELGELVMSCLAKKPQDRPESAGVLQAQLEEILAKTEPLTARALAEFVRELRHRDSNDAADPVEPAATVPDHQPELNRPPDLIAVSELPAKNKRWTFRTAALVLAVALVALGAWAVVTMISALNTKDNFVTEAGARNPHGSLAGAATQPAILVVRCSSWGWVIIDDRKIGLCPIPPTRVAPGKHTIELEDSTGRKTKTIDLQPGEAITVTFGPERKKQGL